MRKAKTYERKFGKNGIDRICEEEKIERKENRISISEKVYFC